MYPSLGINKLIGCSLGSNPNISLRVKGTSYFCKQPLHSVLSFGRSLQVRYNRNSHQNDAPASHTRTHTHFANLERWGEFHKSHYKYIIIPSLLVFCFLKVCQLQINIMDMSKEETTFHYNILIHKRQVHFICKGHCEILEIKYSTNILYFLGNLERT